MHDRLLHIQGETSKHTFHLSISSCFDLYCLSSSSKTCFKPSEFVFKVGSTSSTVLSTKTPLVRRKHLRSLGRGARASATSLPHTRSASASDQSLQKRHSAKCGNAKKSWSEREEQS